MSDDATCPFEGPEKLLEIWFAPSPQSLPDYDPTPGARYGLRTVPKAVWEDMLDIVKCKVLSTVEGREMDAHLLSESSFFVSPHRLILKTCGTTLNLLGLPRILEIAHAYAGFPASPPSTAESSASATEEEGPTAEKPLARVHRCFYSRKSFMFPELQHGPHRDWKAEVEYLDRIFDGAQGKGKGAAYTVGKVNGDHWLLYMTSPSTSEELVATESDDAGNSDVQGKEQASGRAPPDYTIEVLMSDLAPAARQAFFPPSTEEKVEDGDNEGTGEGESFNPTTHAQTLSRALGITHVFPAARTTLDAYAFTPCGYSANALVDWGTGSAGSDAAGNENENDGGAGAGAGEGYYTIHVTPEEGWSYASFECNVPLPARASPTSTTPDSDIAEDSATVKDDAPMPDLQTLIQRVVRIFQPGRLSLTLFISSEDAYERGESAIEQAQTAFRDALAPKEEGEARRYKRTDKINYEFEGYDLAFASFESV
ncbi:S-adenosylmethionine decarboxylase [Cylindrobasidium torrendii FP15055 ss-10]|uniref:S-adenosylmethionine decarboxylase n=1 Tax=Cylindrobasidium torrendii FP15055 ss-10 TaxID=1314674 RepID=A0A0D7B6Q9_9AGAR|nr:S-adenosylmethionine decarboxylase [Cylindrobasidium torrendii FP15055 ss-10]